AFQLIDDVLDYTGDSTAIGKNIGDDLLEGKPTLPLIQATRVGNTEQRALIRQAIEEGGLEHIEKVHEAVENTGAISYTRRLARAEANQAIESLVSLPDSAYKTALQTLANFTVERIS